MAVYSGTKFFIEGLSQGMRKELCKSGVKITCIQPGHVYTEALLHTVDQEVFIVKLNFRLNSGYTIDDSNDNMLKWLWMAGHIVLPS